MSQKGVSVVFWGDITFDLILLLPHFIIILYYSGHNMSIIMEHETILKIDFSDRHLLRMYVSS